MNGFFDFFSVLPQSKSHAGLVSEAVVGAAVGLCCPIAVFSQRSDVPVLVDLGAHGVELFLAEVVHDARADGVAQDVDGSSVGERSTSLS